MPAPKRIDVSDDNALTRLGVTYGVLRRLGYSEETVTRCLESVDGLDLEEAHEWVGGLIAVEPLAHNALVQLFMNCSDEELHPHTRKLVLLSLCSPFHNQFNWGGQSSRTVKRQPPNPSHPQCSPLLWTALEQVYMRLDRHRRPHNKRRRGSSVSDNIFIFTVIKTRHPLFLVPRTSG